MIAIELDSGTVFTYDAGDLSVHLHDENTGYSEFGKIKFSSLGQLEQFREMLEFIEKHNEDIGDKVG